MSNLFARFKIILALIVVLALILVVISACDLGIGPGIPQGPEVAEILAPETNAKVLAQSPVQILSAFDNPATISRVELLVTEPGANTETLLRSDVPDQNGVVLQRWLPQQTGTHTVRVVAYNDSNQVQRELSRQFEAMSLSDVSLPPQLTLVETLTGPEAFQPAMPTALPGPEATALWATEVAATAESAGDAAFEPPAVAVVQVVVEAAEPTPAPRYPPPPPIPGVPPGFTQDQLPDLVPPVCDAAQYLGPFTANAQRRVTATTEDDVPIKTAGGSLVHRVWRMQNIGTCTWGPGYELAFYGGRAMGSGGVAFESVFPVEPGRRNALVDTNRLIVPQGKPNQVAVLEVMLNVPPYPGIHQSYWRMRNPQGVYFGPIVGVTFEVVRDCDFGILGAPVINRFTILGVGDVFRPEGGAERVVAQFGQTVTMDWNIINTTNFDVTLEDPTGNVTTLSNTDPSARAQFLVTELGEYVVTIYADNGACTVTESVIVDVVPRDEDLFELDIILSPTSASANIGNASVAASSELSYGNISARWRHFDNEADTFMLTAQLYQNSKRENCPLVDSIFGWKGHCSMADDWRPVSGSNTTATVTVATGENASQGSATVTNVESNLCRGRVSTERVQYGIRYILRAEKGGEPAFPEFSNSVDTLCVTAPSTEREGGRLPTEIESQQFDPN